MKQSYSEEIPDHLSYTALEVSLLQPKKGGSRLIMMMMRVSRHLIPLVIGLTWSPILTHFD